jgi:hypothetical protein
MSLNENLLLVGMVSGKVKQFLIPQNWVFEKHLNFQISDGQFKPHANRVMGIHGDKSRDIIYTASMDGFLKASHRKTKKTIFVDSIEKIGLTCLFYTSD